MSRMQGYPVRCYAPGCGGPAHFKIAARWSDGATDELKTYSLACPACLPTLLSDARVRRARCRLAPGESLDEPAVYELAAGARDRRLVRRPDLEG
jgi:hypothetical protein